MQGSMLTSSLDGALWYSDANKLRGSYSLFVGSLPKYIYANHVVNTIGRSWGSD
ncbi:hypothetical protein ANO14919_109520 [Xylariales sp. No.14919]|nr:hypothetical protein ANO14919_109520 [Xylariales sp. No.14919]